MSSLVFRCCVVVAFVALIVIAGRLAISDFYYDRANNAYQQLDMSEQRDPRVLESIFTDAEHSLYWRVNSAPTLDLKATLLYQKWWLAPDAQFYADSALLKEADRHHLKALAYRKDWSFTLAQLTLIHSNKEILDEQFEFWFSKAFNIGRYEASIALSLMHIGFRHWAALKQSQKDMTLEFARISIEQKSNSPKTMRNTFEQYGQLDNICENLVKTPRHTIVCTR